MKKILSLIFALLCVCSVTTAQAQEFLFGVKAGLNISYSGLYGQDTEGRDDIQSPKFGLLAGATAEYKFKKPFSVSMEALYSQQGTKYKYPDVDGGEATVTHRFSYINIPVLFNYYFLDDIKISLNIGIQPGFMVGENSTTKYTNGSTTEVWNGAYGWDLEGRDGYKDNGYYTFDLSVPVGVTYSLSNNITFDFRCNIGILDVFDQASDFEINRDFKFTNNNFAISVGYKF